MYSFIPIFIKLIIISPRAQKKNKIALDFSLREPPKISFTYIKTIEKNISIPAQPNTKPTVVNVNVSLNNESAIPNVLNIHANIKTFCLPITSLNTPKMNAISPPNIINDPYVI